MRHLFVCLTLSALSALSGTRDGSGAPLRIYTDFRHDPGSAVESSLHRELASLLAPIALRLDWEPLTGPHDGSATPALVVVTFQGVCNLSGTESRYGSTGALAWTHITDGVILPFIDVDCDRLRALLQAKLFRMNSAVREELFGRALGRVLAHELYHVFANTTHHAKGGVGEPAFTARELLSDDFGFSGSEFHALRSKRLKSVLSPVIAAANKYAFYGCNACHGATGQGTPWAPALRTAKWEAKTLVNRFEKKSDEMYRCARNLKLNWQFPGDEEFLQIVSLLNGEELY